MKYCKSHGAQISAKWSPETGVGITFSSWNLMFSVNHPSSLTSHCNAVLSSLARRFNHHSHLASCESTNEPGGVNDLDDKGSLVLKSPVFWAGKRWLNMSGLCNRSCVFIWIHISADMVPDRQSGGGVKLQTQELVQTWTGYWLLILTGHFSLYTPRANDTNRLNIEFSTWMWTESCLWMWSVAAERWAGSYLAGQWCHLVMRWGGDNEEAVEKKTSAMGKKQPVMHENNIRGLCHLFIEAECLYVDSVQNHFRVIFRIVVADIKPTDWC